MITWNKYTKGFSIKPRFKIGIGDGMGVVYSWVEMAVEKTPYSIELGVRIWPRRIDRGIGQFRFTWSWEILWRSGLEFNSFIFLK